MFQSINFFYDNAKRFCSWLPVFFCFLTNLFPSFRFIEVKWNIFHFLKSSRHCLRILFKYEQCFFFNFQNFQTTYEQLTRNIVDCSWRYLISTVDFIFRLNSEKFYFRFFSTKLSWKNMWTVWTKFQVVSTILPIFLKIF